MHRICRCVSLWLLDMSAALTGASGRSLRSVVTIFLSCLSMALAVALGVLIASGRVYGSRIVRVALTGYVECMRDIVLQGRVPNPLVYAWMLET